MGINQTLSSHISRNLKRFPIKPNIGIATFLGIQIVRNHIPRNLDARNNVNSSVPNATIVLRVIHIWTLGLGFFSFSTFPCPPLLWSLWGWWNLDVGHAFFIRYFEPDRRVTKGECHATTTCSSCSCRKLVEVNNHLGSHW